MKSKLSSSTNAVWYPDFGLTDHIMANLQEIEHIDSNSAKKGVVIANSNENLVLHTSSFFSLSSKDIRLKKILHVPDIKKNLLLINRLCIDIYVSVMFDNPTVYIKDQGIAKYLLTSRVSNGLYKIKLDKRKFLMANQ